MPTLLIASLQPGQGRTTITAGLGACLAAQGRSVRLLRLRSGTGADAAAEDDARALASVPGCAAPPAAVSEQEALAETRAAQAADALWVIEAPAGALDDLAPRLSARVLLISAQSDDLSVGDLASAGQALGDAFVGVVLTRQPQRARPAVGEALRERGVTCLGALPEDRLLAGPTVREMAEALRASRLVEDGDEDEAVEHVMLGPISADPGQPYFLQHGSKAVVNRFDKMDLHLAALATEPACLILTGGQLASSTHTYLIDRVQGSGLAITVLLAPEATVRTVELLDDLYGRTRFAGRRKLQRATELVRERLDLTAILRAP